MKYDIQEFDRHVSVWSKTEDRAIPELKHLEILATFYGESARHNSAVFIAAKQKEQAAINIVNNSKQLVDTLSKEHEVQAS